MSVTPNSTPSGQEKRGPTGAQSRRKSRQRDRPPGLADVASAAHVSTASASRALTRPELVSEALRVRVLDAASTLGYVANAAARSLSTRRSGLVGAVLGDPADPIAMQMLEAAERTLSAHGVGVLIRIAGAAAPAAACAQALLARGVDGLLFIGGGAAPHATDCPGRSVAYLACGQDAAPDGAAPAGETIERRALELVYAYLRQLGHRRIGVIGPRWEEGAGRNTPSCEDAAAIEQRVDDLQDSDLVRAAVRLLVQKEATAIVAPSDLIAAVALRECRALNLAVPQQISVVGWGDSALARCLNPLLTSVRIPARASGQSAAEHLIAIIGGLDFQSPDLPLKLVIRESSGPAPG